MRLWMRTILLCGLVWAAGWGCTGGEPEEAKVAKTGQGKVVFPPPEFYEIGDHEGRAVDLRDFKGRVVLLNFWATWCGPCRYEIPDLVEMRGEYEPDQVAIIGVSLDQMKILASTGVQDAAVRKSMCNDVCKRHVHAYASSPSFPQNKMSSSSDSSSLVKPFSS